MRKPLTDKQKIIYTVVRDFIAKNGRPPTLRETLVASKGLLKLSSVSSVQRHSDALKKKGYIEGSGKYKSAHGLRIKHLRQDVVSIPLVGNIAAGQPILAQENIEAYIPYKVTDLKGDPKQYFFLRAVGDSMNNAIVNDKNIDSGDFVLIKSQSTADPNERVVALIGNEATIKKFKPQKDMIILASESKNKANKDIYVFDDFSIQGVVKDVIKKGGKNEKCS
jgi:repressor LexA